jgi:polyisoprenyl-teichoic acid--peptidoglycan teichoic acid transferase
MAIFIFLELETDEITELSEKGETIKLLIVLSKENSPLSTQLFLFNNDTGSSFLLDIPGNIGSIIEKYNRIDKISKLYEDGGIKEYQTIIEGILGTNIQYFLNIDYSNVEPLTDLLGGIEIFIPEPVEFIDGEEENLLPSGNVLVDGKKVLTFLSYKGSADTIETISDRRQNFVKTILNRMSEQWQYLVKPQVFSMLWNFIETSMDKQSFISFIKLLGSNSIQPDRQRVMGNERLVDNQLLLFPHFEGKLLRQQMEQRLEAIQSDTIENGDGVTITLEILNGTTVNGLARRTKDIYESFQGFNVVAFGNAGRNDVAETLILDRTGITERAERVAEIIGCNNITTDIDEMSESDAQVTVVLGKDFNGQYVKK